MLNPEAADDNIDDGDDKNQHCGGIVEDICCLLMLLISDI